MIWTSTMAENATRGKSTVPWNAQGVSIDTRTLAQGDLFVALTDKRDGHDFLDQAFEKGAAAAVVSRIPEGLDDKNPLHLVDSVQKALEDMACYRRKECTAKCIAVTGSVGKTTTKELLRFVLAKQGKTHASEKSYNNHWGVPLTLARMPKDTEFGIFEIGMNAPGEILPLSMMVQPNVSIVTSVGLAHMAAFDNVEDIAREKADIFGGLTEQGSAIINADLGEVAILEDTAQQKNANIIKFGFTSEAQYRVKEIKYIPGGTQFNFLSNGTEVVAKIAARGEHYVQNVMSVLAAVKEVGGDEVTASLDLAFWQPQDGRGTLKTIYLDKSEDNFSFDLLDDSYNANPVSLLAGLRVVASLEGYKRKVAILSDMLELGAQSPEIHADMANNPLCKSVTKFHCIGPLMKHFYAKLPPEKQGIWVENADEIATRVKEFVSVGDLVFVKGSKGSRASEVVRSINLLQRSS